MNIIKKSIGITQTIKNATRFREMISVFAQNGLDEFIIKSGLHKVIPNFVLPRTRIDAAMKEMGDASWPSIIGYRLRRSFEELGPSFVKFGQLLSTREDLFPTEFIDQMKYLRDRAKGIPFNDALHAINKSLEKNYAKTSKSGQVVTALKGSSEYGGDEVFQSIDPTPIGTASIGLVYRAKLKCGDDVVIKVRRPNIQKIIPIDLAIIEFIVERLERASEEVKYLGISRVIKEFGNGLQNELDFRLEALNCKRIRQNLSLIDKNKQFYIPKVYEEFTCEDMLVLEELKGVPFSSSQKVNEKLGEIQKKLTDGIDIFVKTLLSDGFFHADLHGGNFFLLENGQIGLIDFGLMGHLSKKSRIGLITILYSITTHNYENLVFEFLDIADYDEIPDVDGLVRDVKNALSIFVGLTAQQMNLSLLLNKTVRTLTKHKIYLPREWFIIFRALITLDGVGKSLDMDIDIFVIIEKNLKSVSKEILSRENLVEEGILASRDIVTSLRILPRHIRWFMKEFAKNNYAFELVHTGHERSLNDLRNAMIFLGHSLIASVFFILGVLVIHNQSLGHWHTIPKLSWFFWGVGTIFLLGGIRMIRRS